MAGAHAIIPATTSVTAVVGVFPEGPVGEAVSAGSWAQFVSVFGNDGGRATDAVRQFFQNGGGAASVVRLESAASLPAQLGVLAATDFDLLCIPDVEEPEHIGAACEFCRERSAFLIADPPKDVTDVAAIKTWAAPLLNAENVAGAVYYPWVELAGERLVPPSGSVAGVYARTDATRGVWKAPAGIEATLKNVTALADRTISDRASGELNVEGINSLRTFPSIGNVVWGARTLAGADSLASEFKYVPVRRLADYIERTLRQSLAWAAVEPNAQPLWSAIVQQADELMDGLFADGALAGTTAHDAFRVSCGPATTTPEEMQAGIVNLEVGFAPRRAGEFVVVRLAVRTG